MDESLKAILESLPPKPSRSKLEPYQEFIHELRKRGRSYQEITQILRDRCGVQAAIHTVYNFVRVREKAGKKIRGWQHTTGRSAQIAASPATADRANVQPLPPLDDEDWKNIEVLKRRQRECSAEEKVFTYDEDEPLRLVHGTGHASGGRRK